MRKLGMRVVLTTALVAAVPVLAFFMSLSVTVALVQSIREVWR